MNFTPTEYDLDLIAQTGHGKIIYKVQGWRDRDCVSIEINRSKHRSENETPWRITPNRANYSSREQSEVLDDILAMENTVEALTAACSLSRAIQAQIPRMEKLFQEAESLRQLEATRVAAIKKAEREADVPVGMKLAKHIITQMVYEVKATAANSWDEKTIRFSTRGERKEETLNVRFSHAGLTLFSLGYYRVSKERALSMIADSAIDALKVDSINVIDPKLAKFMMI